ncbi:hypothetical protein [Aminicella lysinilytica]|nr:hypothetical protein [Aminicella lysinilytica]
MAKNISLSTEASADKTTITEAAKLMSGENDKKGTTVGTTLDHKVQHFGN